MRDEKSERGESARTGSRLVESEFRRALGACKVNFGFSLDAPGDGGARRRRPVAHTY